MKAVHVPLDQMIDLRLHPTLTDLEMLSASYDEYAYNLHTHPTFVFGVVTSGVEKLRVCRTTYHASHGSLILVNPEDPHDGQKGCDAGWSYRTCYPSVKLVVEIANELGITDIPLFSSAVVKSPDLARAFVLAHDQSSSEEPLETEASMLIVLREIVKRFGHIKSSSASNIGKGASDRLNIYQEMINANLGSLLSLKELSNETGVTRFQVIRDFKNVLNMTPGQFIRDRRVRRAISLIKTNMSLVHIAFEAGFADQSHFTRTFKASKGLTPAVYRAVILS